MVSYQDSAFSSAWLFQPQIEPLTAIIQCQGRLFLKTAKAVAGKTFGVAARHARPTSSRAIRHESDNGAHVSLFERAERRRRLRVPAAAHEGCRQKAAVPTVLGLRSIRPLYQPRRTAAAAANFNTRKTKEAENILEVLDVRVMPHQQTRDAVFEKITFLGAKLLRAWAVRPL
ncbi:hypothetical protein HPB51_012006 [Rhipicephalus microplus]|uniref:Uncharacterized protein n=1 Tax=Rhipicephalus microplus TaxID=6941 RepID=A0A9J6F229_RHIMP|nr:hypothetical protein HPB51_012006 [Rhipicephalus microplus]